MHLKVGQDLNRWKHESKGNSQEEENICLEEKSGVFEDYQVGQVIPPKDWKKPVWHWLNRRDQRGMRSSSTGESGCLSCAGINESFKY